MHGAVGTRRVASPLRHRSRLLRPPACRRPVQRDQGIDSVVDPRSAHEAREHEGRDRRAHHRLGRLPHDTLGCGIVLKILFPPRPHMLPAILTGTVHRPLELAPSNRGSTAPRMSVDGLGRPSRRSPQFQGFCGCPQPPTDGCGPDLVELGGIEPPSARWSPNLLRPFPTSQLTAAEPAGRPAPRGPLPGLSPASAVFHAVSGLSLRSTPTSVAGLWGSGPVRHRWSRFSSASPEGSGGESELLVVGGSLCVPVLRVRDNSGRTLDFQVPTSKPVSPVRGTCYR